MTATVIIVGQDSRNDTLPPDQNIAFLTLDRLNQRPLVPSARTKTGAISKIEPA